METSLRGVAEVTAFSGVRRLSASAHEASAGKDYFALATRVSLWHDGSRTITAPV